jgi:hypothetical protein
MNQEEAASLCLPLFQPQTVILRQVPSSCANGTVLARVEETYLLMPVYS